MKQIILITILSLFVTFSFGQLKKDDDYQSQTFTIFYAEVVNKLIENANLCDSMQVVEVDQSFYNWKKDRIYYNRRNPRNPLFDPNDSAKIQQRINRLQKSKTEDSVIFEHREKLFFTISSAESKIEYPQEWEIKMNRKNTRINSIRTKYLIVPFKYNLKGRLKKVEFYFTQEVKHFFEGTTLSLRFYYKKGKLSRCYLDELWGGKDFLFYYY